MTSKNEKQLEVTPPRRRSTDRQGVARPGNNAVDPAQVEEALRKYGLRMTRQRRIILDYLTSTREHPSAQQIYDQVRSSEEKVAVATVYNTLGVLVKLGFMKVMEFDALPNRYELNNRPHINMICRSCGKIIELESQLPLVEENFRRSDDFRITDYRMECYGFCAFCRSSG